jgi:integrase
VASAWIKTRATRDGGKRYRVEYRLGGRESKPIYAGSFRTLREATVRKNWITAELVAMRVPDLRLLAAEPVKTRTLTEAAAAWRATRIDVAESTGIFHRTALNRALDVLGDRRVDSLTTDDVVGLVAALHAKGRKRGTISKTLQSLAMVLDDVGLDPNPARDRVKVRLPREEREEPNPPTAAHVEAVYRLLPRKHRLPLLFLDWSGARVAAIDKTLVGDYDEQRQRVRLRAATTKQRRALWVDLHPVLADALERQLGPREDRDLTARLFPDSGADALRTAIAKACRAAGVPLWSPHDLRHRRISLLHLRGVPWARIGEYVGQRDLAVTANTYTHVLTDEAELDYAALVAP